MRPLEWTIEIVELDGHDFHERTKEQAEKDRSRDRQLTQAGYIVFRFTGSEFHKKPEAKVIEVEEFLMKEADKFVKRRRLRFRPESEGN